TTEIFLLLRTLAIVLIDNYLEISLSIILYREISRKSTAGNINLPLLLTKCVLLLLFDTLGYGFEGVVWTTTLDYHTSQLMYYIMYTILGIHFAASTLMFFEFKALTLTSFKPKRKPKLDITVTAPYPNTG
ncbi:hypothetical protein HDV01_000967, partial [Terramyces sp. JEL0728]